MPDVTRFATRAAGPEERVAGFMAHLRENGMTVGVGQTAMALRALEAIDACNITQTRLALRCVCATCAEDAARFDDLFDAYWLNRGRTRQRTASDGKVPGIERRRSPYLVEALQGGGRGAPDRPEAGAADADGTGRLLAVRNRNLARTDLRDLVTPEDVAAAQVIAERIARAIRDRRSRRRKAARRGARLDLRRIARGSVATGGEPLRLYRRRRPDRPVQIVALLDVSGSMQVYARVFLSFLRGLVAADLRADAYLFHTRLVRIGEALRDPDHLRAVNRLSLLAQGFGGGTRIGGALRDFNDHYAPGRVNGRSVVLVLSDGYDTDPSVRAADELVRLRRRGARILWLNPLLGWRGYAPVAGMMQAALPHLDLFAAANTLDSLAALELEIARL